MHNSEEIEEYRLHTCLQITIIIYIFLTSCVNCSSLLLRVQQARDVIACLICNIIPSCYFIIFPLLFLKLFRLRIEELISSESRELTQFPSRFSGTWRISSQYQQIHADHIQMVAQRAKYQQGDGGGGTTKNINSLG